MRQLRLRDIGGIIVVDFIDMVLESNRDLVSRRLIECLSRDRTKHQVAEVTSLGLVQMTRKKLGLGLLESFSENCEACAGRGIIVHHDPVIKHRQTAQPPQERRPRAKNGSPTGNIGSSHNRDSSNQRELGSDAPKSGQGTHGITEDAKQALALIAARTITRTGSIATVPAAALQTDAAAESTLPDSTGADSTDAANTDAASAESSRAELVGTVSAPAESPSRIDGTQAGTESNTAPQPDAAQSEQPGERSRGRQSRSRGQGGRGQQSRSERARQASAEQGQLAVSAAGAVSEPQAAVIPAAEAEHVPATDSSASVDILDIPVAKSGRTTRRPSKQVTDQLLDSVLDSLPEPKLPGQGRARSRRVTTAGGSTGQAIVSASGTSTSASTPLQPPHAK